MRPVFRDILLTSLAAEEAGVELVGMTVQMDLPELGLTGEAIVTDIRGCSAIEPRAGAGDDRRIVTATFHHSSGDVIDLVLADEFSDLTTPDLNPETQTLKPVGEADSIGTTSNHPFWSVDRQEYVQAGQLRVGERLQTLHGDTKIVVSNLPRPGPKTDVYNLEVHAEHVYFVGEDGVLVHNSQNYGLAGAKLGFEQTHKAVRGYQRFGKRYLNRLVDSGLANAEDVRRIRGTAVLQKISQREADRLSNTPGLLKELLTETQNNRVMEKGEGLLHMFYGSALEKKLVATRVRNNPILRRLYRHVGNGGSNSTVDFVGQGVLDGLGFDLTTIGQLPGKRRLYGEGVLVPIYHR